MALKGQVSIMMTENQVKNYLKFYDMDYVNKLIESLYEHEDKDIDSSHKACPICGSVHYKNNGKCKNVHQKYICFDCQKSFGDRTNTLFCWSHFMLNQWIYFIGLELYKMTIDNEAHILGTSKTTCLYMRYKLYHAESEIMSHQKLFGELEKIHNIEASPKGNVPSKYA